MSTRRPIYLPTYLYIHSDESRYVSIYMFSLISVYFDTFSRFFFCFFLDSCPLYVQFVETLIFTCINSEEGERRKRLVEHVFLHC